MEDTFDQETNIRYGDARNFISIIQAVKEFNEFTYAENSSELEMNHIKFQIEF